MTTTATEAALTEAQATVRVAERHLADALSARAEATRRAHAAGVSLYRIAQVYGVGRKAVYDDLARP